MRTPYVYLDFCFYANCNFTCTYCRDTNEGMSRGRGREAVDAALASFLEHASAAVLKLSGYGEATLWPELPATVARWAPEFPTVQLITNGAGPRAAYRALAELPNFSACVTLDGHVPEMDRFRTKGRPALHRRVVGLVDSLVAEGRQVELNCVLSQANADRLDEYLAWVAATWGDRAMVIPFPVRPTLGREAPDIADELSPTPPQLRRLVEVLVDRHPEFAEVLPPLAYSQRLAAFLDAGRRTARCHVHRANFGVNTELLALACACAGDRLIAPLGTMEAVWTSPEAAARQARYLAAGDVGRKCAGCFTHYDLVNLYLEGAVTDAEIVRVPSLSAPGAVDLLRAVREELRSFV